MANAPLLERCSYPRSLPVSQYADDIIAAIKENQVVVVAGHTGSGKTTQLPKMCFAAGFGAKAQIAHTQPRRLAAITVAERIAAELQTPLGEEVGYQIRFDKQYAQDCRLKLQTDGVLLNEIQRDPLLRQYDCIIVDEAHERSLNIDFLLGYLKRLLPRRPELHLVITSATIDTKRFASFFGGAVVMEVEGTTFPIEYRYADYDADSVEQVRAIANAIEDIEQLPIAEAEKRGGDSAKVIAADVLCFMSTEQEIIETSRFLRGRLAGRFDVLPLYSRLPAKQQKKVFQRPPDARRRIILATNIAETSLTVPAIGFVIDTGLCRLSRYNFHNKIQQLPIEEVSQASANQRAGRCGRLAPGVCIRLYSEQNFSERPEFSEPEILRTNLASIILRLHSIGVHDIEGYEFIDPPDARLLRDGLRLLEELQALEPRNDGARLTDIGRQLARLPLEPRLGRILLAGQQRGCLSECLVICAALSTVDPRERPAGKQEQADKLHKRFADPRSDFFAMLKLWRYLQDKKRALSPAAFRKLLGREFLAWQRVNDWMDVHQQLSELVKDIRQKNGRKNSGFEAIHRALLSGFVTQVGVLGEKREFTGTRQRQFKIFPGSVLARKPPRLLVAAEIVETGAVYARHVAKVKPLWVIDAAPHLLKRHVDEPYYDSETGRVKAYESASLQGVSLSERRSVMFPVNDEASRVLARQIFLQQALVQGQWQNDLPFNRHNQALASRLDDLVARLRRPEIDCLAESLLDLFESVVPDDVYSARHFEKWYAQLDQQQAKRMELSWSQALTEQPDASLLSRFPDTLAIAENQFALRYKFAPGSESDGLEVLVPESMQSIIGQAQLDVLVPGMLAEKCIALLKTLPKNKRRPMVPIADAVSDMLDEIHALSGPLLHRLKTVAREHYKVQIDDDDWDQARLPDYLFARLSIVDSEGNILRSRRQRDELTVRATTAQETSLTAQAGQASASTAGNEGSDGHFYHAAYDGRAVDSSNYPELPPQLPYQVLGLNYIAYPALLQTQNAVILCLYHRATEANIATAWALASLYQRALAQQARTLKQKLFSSNADKLALAVFPARDQFVQDSLQRLFFEAFDCVSYRPENAEQWQAQLRRKRSDFEQLAEQWSKVLQAILAAHYELVQNSQSVSSSHFQPALEDVNQQLNGLLCSGFLQTVPAEYLQHYPRYIRAAAQRLTRLREQQGRDSERQAKVNQWETRQRDEQPGRAYRTFYQQSFYWSLQEYRVSLFAQALGTAEPVSETRLKAAWESRFETDAAG